MVYMLLWCQVQSLIEFVVDDTPPKGPGEGSDVTMTLNLNKFEHGLIILTKSIGFNGRFPRCVLTERDWVVIVIAGGFELLYYVKVHHVSWRCDPHW
jgi:hypothetical protein